MKNIMKYGLNIPIGITAVAGANITITVIIISICGKDKLNWNWNWIDLINELTECLQSDSINSFIQSVDSVYAAIDELILLLLFDLMNFRVVLFQLLAYLIEFGLKTFNPIH